MSNANYDLHLIAIREVRKSSKSSYLSLILGTFGEILRKNTVHFSFTFIWFQKSLIILENYYSTENLERLGLDIVYQKHLIGF